MLTVNLSDWKYRNIWNNIEEYLNTLSSGNMVNWSCILSAKNWAKLKTVVGGLSGKKIERKPSIGSFTCSSVVYPRIQDNMVTIYLVLSKKMVVEYGGLSIGTCVFSRRKVWKIWDLFGRSSFKYISIRFSLENGASLGFGWIWNISFIDLVVIVNKFCCLGETMVIWLGK